MLRSRGEIADPWGDKIGRVTCVIVIVYLVEVGLVLIVAPWTRFWDRNYFVEVMPWLEAAITRPSVRGSVSGFGIVCVAAAVLEALAALRGLSPGRKGGGPDLLSAVKLGPKDLRRNP